MAVAGSYIPPVWWVLTPPSYRRVCEPVNLFLPLSTAVSQSWPSGCHVPSIETGQVKLEEIFLPYMVDTSGATLYERMQENNFKLPRPNKDERDILTGTLE
jgi:hypothetical protein